MFETLSNLFSRDDTTVNYSGKRTQQETQRVLTMVKNERMGGYVPKWETVLAEVENTATEPANAKDAIEQRLSDAAQSFDGPGDRAAQAAPPSPYAHGYSAHASGVTESSAPKHEPFGFGDLIDMVNPLHHIPVVGSVYRELTGDEIRPIGNIIGGAAFGGPMGLATGLINAVVEGETGKQVEEHAMAFVLGRDDDEAAPSIVAEEISREPITVVQAQINDETTQAAASVAPVSAEVLEDVPSAAETLPGTVISVAQLGHIVREAKQNQPLHQSLVSSHAFKPQGSIAELFTTPDPHLMKAAGVESAGQKEDKDGAEAQRMAFNVYGVY